MEAFELEMQRDRFLKIFDGQIGDREGKEALREWLLSDACDFFSAPASTKYHGVYTGGLCEHSLDVYDMAVRLEGLYREDMWRMRRRRSCWTARRPSDRGRSFQTAADPAAVFLPNPYLHTALTSLRIMLLFAKSFPQGFRKAFRRFREYTQKSTKNLLHFSYTYDINMLRCT